MRATTCISRAGKPLSAYSNRTDAEDAAAHAQRSFGRSMVPYRCDRCASWHLCPADRHTPNHECGHCSKRAYHSHRAAEMRASIIAREQHTLLRVYECPVGEGWHLTHDLTSDGF